MTRNQRGDPDLPPGPARELVALFRRLRSTSPLTVGQLALRTGLAAGHVSEVLRGWKAPSPGAAGAIVRALGADDRSELKARRLAEELAELNRYNRAKTRNRTVPVPPGRGEPGHGSPVIFLLGAQPDSPVQESEAAEVIGVLGDRPPASPVIVLCATEVEQVITGLARLLGLAVEAEPAELRLIRGAEATESLRSRSLASRVEASQPST